LQVHRLRAHHDNLVKEARASPPIPGFNIAMHGAEACSDFEGLLLQGRACLDRLTYYIATRFKDKTSSFRRLPNTLELFEGKSEEAAQLLAVIRNANSWFGGMFGKLDTPNSLRDLVAHDHALTEGIQTCFAAHRLDLRRGLIIDCEVQLPYMRLPIPLLQTAHESARWISYVVLECLAAMLRRERLDLAEYVPTWENLSVVLSQFVIDEPAESPLGPYAFATASRMVLDGVRTRTHNMDPTFFERAFVI